jgi:hypothetical protein
MAILSRPFGTWHTQATVPALKRWAMFSHPSGMTALKSYDIGLSSPVFGQATGKSPEPADKNVCPT